MKWVCEPYGYEEFKQPLERTKDGRFVLTASRHTYFLHDRVDEVTLPFRSKGTAKKIAVERRKIIDGKHFHECPSCKRLWTCYLPECFSGKEEWSDQECLPGLHDAERIEG